MAALSRSACPFLTRRMATVPTSTVVAGSPSSMRRVPPPASGV